MGPHEHIRNLGDIRLRVWEETKRFLEDIAAEKRDMTAAENDQWNRYNARLDELAAEIRATQERERFELESAAANVASGMYGEHRGLSAHQAQEAREADLIRRFAAGDPTVGEPDPENLAKRVLRIPVGRAREERELLRQGVSPSEARALAWDTGSIASGVPTLMAQSLYEYFEAAVALWRAPTTKVMTTSGAQMKLPRLAAHGIATQVSGQGTTLAGTDPTFASLTLDAFKYAELVRVSNEVLTDTSFPVAQFLARDIARAVGRKVATDFAIGSGSNKPNGLMTALAASGMGSVVTGGTTTTSLTFENLIDTVYAVNDEYRSSPSVGWVMADSTGAKIRRIRDGAGGTTGAFIWQPSQTVGLSGGAPALLLGYPVWTDPNIASMASNNRVAAFGALEGYYIRAVGDILIERDDSRWFDTDEVGFRGKWRVDGDLMDTSALISLNNSVV